MRQCVLGRMNPYGGEGPGVASGRDFVDLLCWDGRGTHAQRLAGLHALGHGIDPGPFVDDVSEDEAAHSDGMAGQPGDDWFHDDSSDGRRVLGEPPE